MWLLTFIPDGIIHGFVNCVFYAGVIASLLGFVFNFGFLSPYRLIVQVVGILLLVAGVYFKGGYEVEMQWRERAAELQAKIDAAAVKSQETNTVIKTKVITKIKKIKEVQVQLQKEIVEKEKIINAECVVPKEAIEILNKAAEGPSKEETK
jgi:preprotein translocase subunit SecF